MIIAIEVQEMTLWCQSTASYAAYHFHLRFWSMHALHWTAVINSQRMREGYSTQWCLCVCVCVCVSVTTITKPAGIRELQLQSQRSLDNTLQVFKLPRFFDKASFWIEGKALATIQIYHRRDSACHLYRGQSYISLAGRMQRSAADSEEDLASIQVLIRKLINSTA